MDVYELAKDFILNTSESVFLTGKAGTGKTTLLKYIRENTGKNCVIAAPTGVAAINAGGVTLHSLFHLPFAAFIPEKNKNYAVNNPATLFETIKLNKQKIQLLREMELLVIDEISMCRCDILDEIDLILRSYRRQMNIPFGGVQVLFIGDLFQLPPVVKDDEWRILNDYYQSPFFFSARVMQELPILHIELENVFRQTDENFIDLLNSVRNNNMLEDDLVELNHRLNPYARDSVDNAIILTTHNWKADKINQEELKKIDREIFTFYAHIEGDFPEFSFPVDKEMHLKKGAQVMFTKNDITTEKRYYNGKIGTIIQLSEEEILVRCADDGIEVEVEAHTWENKRYTYNETNDKIEEDSIGSYSQFPLRLAWAVTIHKSQGLTFDHVIIDAGQAFSAGQVYVALSRCRTLEGIHLMTPIPSNAIFTDERILEFCARKKSAETLASYLPLAKFEFSKQKLLNSFSWNKVIEHVIQFQGIIHEKQIPEKEKAMALAINLEKKLRELEQVSERFMVQLKDILNYVDQEEYRNLLNERVLKSIYYFGDTVNKEMILPLQEHIEIMRIKNKTKGYIARAKQLEQIFIHKLQEIERLKFGDTPFYNGNSFYKNKEFETSIAEHKKPEKGSSPKESLRMYKEGKKIAEIAAIREMATSTIESHLLPFIQNGELNFQDFIAEDAYQEISKTIEMEKLHKLGELKTYFGDKYSFFQLRIGLNKINSF